MKPGDRVEVTLTGKRCEKSLASGTLRKIEGRQTVVELDAEYGGERIWIPLSGLVWVPSPDEIAAATGRIKDGMSRYERWRRSGGKDGAHHDDPYETPIVDSFPIRSALASMQAIEFG